MRVLVSNIETAWSDLSNLSFCDRCDSKSKPADHASKPINFVNIHIPFQWTESRQILMCKGKHLGHLGNE